MINLLEVLHKEIMPAEGCTEPIAVAYAVSLAAELVEEEITAIQLLLSGNIIKNAMGVGIPGTGQTGLPIAAALGAVVRRSERKLEILSGLTSAELASAEGLLERKLLEVELKDTPEKLYRSESTQQEPYRHSNPGKRAHECALSCEGWPAA